MKKSLIIFCSLLVLGFSACQSQGKKNAENTKNADTATVVASENAEGADMQGSLSAEDDSQNATEASSSDNIAKLVKLTLASKYKSDIDKGIIDEASRKFVYSEFDLNGDSKKEIFVGLTGPYFCGSGGCSVYLLDNQGNIITYFSVADYPIVIDAKKTNGWNDLLMNSRGKFHTMKFNGKKYPSNPSVQKTINKAPSADLPKVLNEPFTWHNF